MKRFYLLLLVACMVGAVTGWGAGCLRTYFQHAEAVKATRADEYGLMMEPAPGRIPYVDAASLVANPANYDRARIIVEGRWFRGFEESTLVLDAEPEGLPIRAECDWARLNEPTGNFSPKNKMEEWDLAARGDRIVAEGTFHYRARGFSQLTAYDGFFLIDRLLACEPSAGEDTARR